METAQGFMDIDDAMLSAIFELFDDHTKKEVRLDAEAANMNEKAAARAQQALSRKLVRTRLGLPDITLYDWMD
jgi:hypothetical protein